METAKKKSKRPGRPEKAIKKEIRACIRLTKAEHFIIRHKAAKANTNVSDYLRQLAINAEILSRLNAEELQFVRQLIGMSNNMNQVAKICHREGMFQGMQYFEEYRNQIDRVLSKLKS